MPKSTKRRSVANKKKRLCDHCKKEIKEESDDYIQCDKCGNSYHSQCSGLSRREFDRLYEHDDELFSCQLCESGNGNGEIKKELITIKTELKKLEKLEKLDQLTESIQFMSEKFDVMIKDVAENKKKITEIQKENKKLKTEVETLKSSVKLLNDHKVKNDCIISGLKVKSDVKAIDAVMQLSEEVGVKFELDAVDDAFYLGNRNTTREEKSIVVKFASKKQKDKLMSAKQKLRQNDETKKVYVNDFLSKETLNLLAYAKSLKTIGYRYIYARDGKVFCKKSELSRQQIVRCPDDVDKMLSDATTSKHWERRSMVRNRQVIVPSSDEEEDEKEDEEEEEEDGAEYVSPT